MNGEGVLGGLRSVARSVADRVGAGHAVEGFERDDVACLTFDDGPDPEGTVAVLEALRQVGAGATFFVMANRVDRYPSLVKEVLAEGHELALHGPDHRDLTHCGPLRVRGLLTDARARVEDVAGTGLRWFRPPYVALRVDGWAALRGSGIDFVASGAAIPDWRPELTDHERLAHLGSTLSAGDVILAHDSWATVADGAYPGPEPQVDRGWLTARSLELLADRGLRSVTLSAAATADAPARTAVRVALRPTRVGA